MPSKHAQEPLEGGSEETLEYRILATGSKDDSTTGCRWWAQIKVTSIFNWNQKVTCRQMEKKNVSFKKIFLLILAKPREHRELEIYVLIHVKVVLIKDDFICG